MAFSPVCHYVFDTILQFAIRIWLNEETVGSSGVSICDSHPGCRSSKVNKWNVEFLQFFVKPDFRA
jgi:hypothetical protein